MKKIMISFLLLTVLLLAGCAEEEEGTAKLYFLNSSGNDIETLSYLPGQGDTETRILEMLTLMTEQRSSEDEEGLQTLLPSGILLEEYSYTDQQVSLDFSAAFKDLDPGRKNLIYAGFTLGLCQIDGVEQVLFKAGGQAVRDSYGKRLVAMTEESFLDGTGMDVNSYSNVTLKLYFLTLSGDELATEERNVYCSSSIPLERIVVEELIKGPEQADHRSPLSQDASVLSAVKQDGQSYVNLDEGTVTGSTLADSEKGIAGVVRSIQENCETEGVQLSVDGEIIYSSVTETADTYSEGTE